MIPRLLIALALAAVVFAQTLSSPQIGFIEDSGRAVRPVYGIAGNFLLGNAAPGLVVSSAASGKFLMIKTDSAIIARGRSGQIVASVNAPAGPALFSFLQDGTPGLAYLPAANELFQWTGAGFQAVALDAVSAVISIASPDPAHAALIVQRGDGLWVLRVLLASGNVDSQSALIGVNAPALMLPSGDIVYAAVLRRGRLVTHPGVVIRRTDGSEIELS